MTTFRLKDLRDLSVIVVHPLDQDGKALLDQLNRIGCRTELVWPPTKALPPGTDIVIAGVFFEWQNELKAMLKKTKASSPTVLAIVNYENPAMLQNVLELGAFAVISKPIREFGMLINLVVARSKWEESIQLAEKSVRLQKKIVAQKNIASAKEIIMELQSISESEAYRVLRSKAMAKRVSIEEMAVAVINANDLLSKGIDRV
ncbi:Response regulator with putative antiterminator output domain protein [Hoeflea phototrophica DFL-43]|jgi:AmiR/NasT family two-component response regulator|uniref:Response regulator with putative antiterminator output domain protein n=1 Tax=Hoeflea phototrophica (strain DSM 17068 / NCIMB 14078 / DFL-43) TaxID=411684 RepID=A9CZG7_HOEPD|nr:ANTAR domain-containing protein [Hoeflea phototrophica]EDQ34766.2 Response regulator with putative antiterminator output domain protein [Hoeflea phototrophica DFL-43]